MSLKKKLLALVVALVVCVSFMPVLASADLVDEEKTLDAGDDIALTVQATNENPLIQLNRATAVSGKTVTYEHGTATLSGDVLLQASDNGFVAYTTENSVTFTLSPEEGYEGSVLREGQQVAVVNNSAVIEVKTGEHAATNVDVLFKSKQNGGNQDDDNQGNTTARVSITGGVDFSVNGSRFEPGPDPVDPSEPVVGELKYNSDKTDTTVTVRIETLFIEEVTSLTINGANYTPNIMNYADPTTWLAHYSEQHLWFEIPGVPKADNYNVVATVASGDPDHAQIGNFLWSYKDEDAGTDDYLDHGRIEFVNLNYNGADYSQAQLATIAPAGQMRFEEFNNGQEGGAILPAGATLTVKLVPEYGYQLTSFTINGGAFNTGEAVSTFSFVVPHGNFHLGAHFTKVADAVASTSDNVTGGAIELTAGLVDSGSALLSVASAEPTAAATSAFVTAAGTGFTVSSYLDLSLNKVVYKGKNSAEGAWTAPLGADGEFEEPVTVTLQVADGVVPDGATVEVLHEKHDGSVEVIQATYDAATRTISFKTKSFSDYAIATKGGAAKTDDTKATSKATTAKTGDPLSTTGVAVFALAAFGAVAFAARRLREQR